MYMYIYVFQSFKKKSIFSLSLGLKRKTKETRETKEKKKRESPPSISSSIAFLTGKRKKNQPNKKKSNPSS